MSDAAAVLSPAPKAGRPARHHNAAAVAVDLAADVLNGDGLTNSSLERVAERLGLTKSAIYYYFRDKEELVFKCYLRACHLGISHAEAAERSGGSGRDRLLKYLRLQFEDSNPPVAIVSEIAFLKDQHRAKIRKLARQHDDVLRGILDRGVSDGSLSVVDPPLVNFAIIGTLNWTLVWARKGPGYLLTSQVAERFIDIFMYGFKPAGPALRSWPAPVTIPWPPASNANVFERSFQASQKQEALFRAASDFFNRNGYDDASIDDIADSLGVTRGAFYHYVGSKEELLYRCYTRSLDLTDRVLAIIAQDSASGLEQLMRYIASMIELHAGALGPMANYVRQKSLSSKHQAEVRERSHRLQGIVAGFFERGIRDGSVRTLDVRMSRLALQGAINWLPRWYSPDGPRTPVEVAASFSALFVNGMAPRS